ncbi:hypothetical protein GYMLUDRAFT_65525 [Collybiopsis luxurians FD-317 M1]|uniref:Uncharacterized protein n=1 Tax=Collybiopsis luxurians FD-317 M1 TaxID=944289 RepID=A0A0D0BW81_9AGAR|nr:hypothetical protein GYMLUDRAFT_65525 [Collybiopsis luxurians FD-317 M1]
MLPSDDSCSQKQNLSSSSEHLSKCKKTMKSEVSSTDASPSKKSKWHCPSESELALQYAQNQLQWALSTPIPPCFEDLTVSIQVIMCNTFSSSISPVNIEEVEISCGMTRSDSTLLLVGNVVSWTVPTTPVPFMTLPTFTNSFSVPICQRLEAHTCGHVIDSALYKSYINTRARGEVNIAHLQELGLGESPSSSDNHELLSHATQYY